jgi:hypothetical protein
MLHGVVITVRPSAILMVKIGALTSQSDSDIVHFSVMNNHVVVLNSAEAAADLFEKRGAIYSDRPWTTMSSELYVMSSFDRC